MEKGSFKVSGTGPNPDAPDSVPVREKKSRSKGPVMTYVVPKGQEATPRDAEKNSIIEIVLKFMSKTTGCRVRIGKYSFLVTDLDAENVGNAKWVLDNVFRKVYITGIRGTKDIDERVDMLMNAFIDANPPKSVVGTSLLTYWLDYCYLNADMFMESR